MNAKRSKICMKLPPTACAFYIKLFCKRKGTIKSKYHNSLLEATKSWLSLNESEKQKFSKKFKECEENYRMQFFEQLKTAKPYMKVKKTSLKSNDVAIDNLENKEPEERCTHNNPESELREGLFLERNSENILDNEEINSKEPSINEFEEQHLNVTGPDRNDEPPPPSAFLIEPIPPTIRTGHELFNMLNSTESGKTWTVLPQNERNLYNRAVSLLKKDYISKYKEYLESLSPKELFDCYYKTIG